MTSEDTGQDVGRRLAAARLARGLAQNEVARRAKIAPSYLSRIENSKVHPTIGMTMQILGALGASPDEVLGSAASRASRGPCPVTSQGHCLLDLIRPVKQEGAFTPREVRLIRRFASWVEGAEPARLRAMEILLEDLSGESTPPG